MNMHIKDIILGIIIAVVFLMFAVYGTKLIYDAPDYEDYCDYSRPMIPNMNKNCSYNESLSDERQQCYNEKGTPISVYDENGCEVEINCSTCQQDYDTARERYSQNLFIISIIISVVVISISALFIKIESISGGLMLGSLMYLIYGTGFYWRYMDDLLRFIILGLALGILIYIGYKIGKRE